MGRPMDHSEHFGWGRVSFWKDKGATGSDRAGADTMQIEVGFGLDRATIAVPAADTHQLAQLKCVLDLAFKYGGLAAKREIRDVLGVKERP